MFVMCFVSGSFTKWVSKKSSASVVISLGRAMSNEFEPVDNMCDLCEGKLLH